MARPLPTAREAADILARKRTRPLRRPPPPAGTRLTALIRDIDARFGQGVGGLEARWREIVGEPLARASAPARLIGSRSGGSSLEIRVDGPAAALIQHQAPQILERVNLIMGTGAVTRLRIVQGPVRRSAAAPRLTRKSRPPLDAAQEAQLEADLSRLENDDLKNALSRLGRHILRQQRDR